VRKCLAGLGPAPATPARGREGAAMGREPRGRLCPLARCLHAALAVDAKIIVLVASGCSSRPCPHALRLRLGPSPSVTPVAVLRGSPARDPGRGGDAGRVQAGCRKRWGRRRSARLQRGGRRGRLCVKLSLDAVGLQLGSPRPLRGVPGRVGCSSLPQHRCGEHARGWPDALGPQSGGCGGPLSIPPRVCPRPHGHLLDGDGELARGTLAVADQEGSQVLDLEEPLLCQLPGDPARVPPAPGTGLSRVGTPRHPGTPPHCRIPTLHGAGGSRVPTGLPTELRPPHSCIPTLRCGGTETPGAGGSGVPVGLLTGLGPPTAASPPYGVEAPRPLVLVGPGSPLGSPRG